MNGLTNYITEQAWVDTITIWYVLVDDACQRVITQRGSALCTRGCPVASFNYSLRFEAIAL